MYISMGVQIHLKYFAFDPSVWLQLHQIIIFFYLIGRWAPHFFFFTLVHQIALFISLLKWVEHFSCSFIFNFVLILDNAATKWAGGVTEGSFSLKRPLKLFKLNRTVSQIRTQRGEGDY